MTAGGTTHAAIHKEPAAAVIGTPATVARAAITRTSAHHAPMTSGRVIDSSISRAFSRVTGDERCARVCGTRAMGPKLGRSARTRLAGALHERRRAQFWITF